MKVCMVRIKLYNTRVLATKWCFLIEGGFVFLNWYNIRERHGVFRERKGHARISGVFFFA
jgi:hypothetical protein